MARRGGRITINHGGARELLTSARVKALVRSKAEALAARCNAESSWGGYHTEDASGATRARYHVLSADKRNDENRDNRLLRNLGGL